MRDLGATVVTAIHAYNQTVVDRRFPTLAETARPGRIGDEQLERMFSTLRNIHPAMRAPFILT